MEEACYFCGCNEVALFHEHYYFCTDCTTIYNYPIVQEKNCEHISDSTPEVLREPWYAEVRAKEKPFINPIGEKQYCSVCMTSCMADGW